MSMVIEDARDKAKRLNMKLVEPTSSQVFVDIDSDEAYAEFKKRFLLLGGIFDFVEISYDQTSQTPGHRHIIVEVLDIELQDDRKYLRLILQAALGSDPIREMLAVKHHMSGYEYTSVFFEKPKQLEHKKEV